MAGEPRYRKDLFQGTAEYYDRFRPPYPGALIADLCARARLGRESRVLDLACATGQIAFPMAAVAGDVWAVDQEPELVEFGVRKAEQRGVANIRWIAAAAEDVSLDGAFDLVAIGNAFHRLDRDTVARRLVPHLGASGGVALLWGGTAWRGEQPWQRVLHDTLERWQDEVDARDRVPAGWEAAIERDSHPDVLRRAGLVYEGSFDFTVEQRWTADSLIGLVLSSSFLNPTVLGSRIEEFERDLRELLLACSPDDSFDETLAFRYEFARRP